MRTSILLALLVTLTALAADPPLPLPYCVPMSVPVGCCLTSAGTTSCSKLLNDTETATSVVSRREQGLPPLKMNFACFPPPQGVWKSINVSLAAVGSPTALTMEINEAFELFYFDEVQLNASVSMEGRFLRRDLPLMDGTCLSTVELQATVTTRSHPKGLGALKIQDFSNMVMATPPEYTSFQPKDCMTPPGNPPFMMCARTGSYDEEVILSVIATSDRSLKYLYVLKFGMLDQIDLGGYVNFLLPGIPEVNCDIDSLIWMIFINPQTDYLNAGAKKFSWSCGSLKGKASSFLISELPEATVGKATVDKIK
jgi:hypothetical protein